MHLSVRSRLFLSHFLAVLLVSGSIGSFFYLRAVASLTESIQARLVNTAALIGQVLDATELAAIRKASDRANPVYAKNLALLRHMGRTNPDIAYLYVMRHSGGQVYFVLDSDESDAQAAPGRHYPDQTPPLMRGFQRPSVDDQVYTDEWGAFLSGYSPLRNGYGEYLVGVDMRAEELERKLSGIRLAGWVSLGLSVLLALLFSRILSSHVTKPVLMLIDRCRAIAQGDPDRLVEMDTGDELGQLVDAFNLMSRQLSESRAHAESAQQSLKQARDLQEMRVAERTRDLVEANERLLHEVAERARAEELLAHAARSDPLTGLVNRRAMLEQMEYQALRFQRNHTPFTLLLADLDRFKSINDSHGHDVGDEALVQVAQQLRHSIRAQDLVARWGGEEFLILLPDTDLAGGMAVAESLRKAVDDEPLSAGDQRVQLTLSLGVAAYDSGMTLNQCIKAADTALYQAKLQGRNRVVAASGAARPGTVPGSEGAP